jgi:hypothetical protein
VASYGEEAHVLLRADDEVGAIRLYAVQAAHGSQSGATSLLFVARRLVGSEARLRRALRDPLAQRLMTTYAWTRGQEEWSESAKHPSNRLLDALAVTPALAGADRLAAAAWRMGRFDLAARFADKQGTPLGLWVQAKLALRRGDRGAAELLLDRAARQFSEAAARDRTSHGRLS